MKWFFVVAGSLIAVVGVVALVGYFLPVAHVASRSADFERSPDAVFALVSDLAHYSTWWPENETAVEVVEVVPPSKIVTRIVGETDFGGTWTMEIHPIPTGSRLTITERGEVYNPVFRVLSRFVFGHTSTMESCLVAARRRLAHRT